MFLDLSKLKYTSIKPSKTLIFHIEAMSATHPRDQHIRQKTLHVQTVLCVTSHESVVNSVLHLYSLTFSPSTTSNSTVSPSPTLRKYFRGLFFFIAVFR